MSERSHRSLQKSDHEWFMAKERREQVTLFHERINFCAFAHKNEQFAQKTDEQISNPGFMLRFKLFFGTVYVQYSIIWASWWGDEMLTSLLVAYSSNNSNVILNYMLLYDNMIDEEKAKAEVAAQEDTDAKLQYMLL